MKRTDFPQKRYFREYCNHDQAHCTFLFGAHHTLQLVWLWPKTPMITTKASTKTLSAQAISSSTTSRMHTTSICGEKGHSAVHIPLPIIVYSEAHGLDVFAMSSAFEGHGDVRTAVRPSGATYELSHGHIALVDDHNTHHNHDGHDYVDHSEEGHEGHAHHGPAVYDLSITKSIFGMLLMLGLMVVLFESDGWKLQEPSRSSSYRVDQCFGATGSVSARRNCHPQHWRKEGGQVLPFLMTVFFFIFFANLLGLVPLLADSTSRERSASPWCWHRWCS